MFALLGRRSRFPTAPNKQRRFSWSKKRICCQLKVSRLPSAPVPLLTMTESTKDVSRRKKAVTKLGQQNKTQTTLKRTATKPARKNRNLRTITKTSRSTIKMTDSSIGREATTAPTKSNTVEKRKVVPSTSTTRLTRPKVEIKRNKPLVKRTKVDGSLGGASSKRSALSTARPTKSEQVVEKKPLSNKRSERRTPRSFPITQQRLQSPRSSLNKRPKTNKPIVRRLVSDKSRTKTSLSNSQLTSSTNIPGGERKPKSNKTKGDQKSKPRPKDERPVGVTAKLESKPATTKTNAAAKPEMSLWKRLKNQMTTNKEKTASNSAGPKRGMSWRRRSYPGADFPTSGDTDADSVSTAQPILAKGNPVDVFFPITPRSLTLTNVHEDGETTPQGTVLQRCTTLSPEPNPSAVFRQFQSGSELQSEQKEETLYTAETTQETELDTTGKRVFSPAGVKVAQKDMTYSSASADILQTHSSASPSPIQAELKPKGSPRRVFSNPLLSPSPELRPCPTNLEIPISMGMPALRIPNMPASSRSDGEVHTISASIWQSMTCSQTTGGTTRRLDSSQIEARCEWIRETLKEESQRLITMTTMLEGLQVSPRPAASIDINSASNQDLNRRYIERINDLQLENRHLRQLLEFSIGSMRRQSWIPGPAPATPCYGSSFTNPIAEIEDATEPKRRRDSMPKASNKAKQHRNDPEYVSRLKDTLDAKEQLLKVVDESYTQITSLKSWYDKRLVALDKDRKRLQSERSECLKELKRCGGGVKGNQPSRKKKSLLEPTSFSRSLDMTRPLAFHV